MEKQRALDFKSELELFISEIEMGNDLKPERIAGLQQLCLKNFRSELKNSDNRMFTQYAKIYSDLNYMGRRSAWAIDFLVEDFNDLVLLIEESTPIPI